MSAGSVQNSTCRAGSILGWNKKLARSLSKSREVLASRLEYLDAAVRFCRFTSQWLRADLRWTQTMIEVQIVFTVGVITARNKCS